MLTPLHGGTAIGVDIGGTNVRAARVDRGGRLDGLRKVATGSDSSIADLVADLCRELIDDGVRAVGIGIPGRLDQTGTAVQSSGYVDLAGQRLGEDIGDRLGLPAVLDNDAHMALVAELRHGAAADAQNVVLFTVGTGIGGAVAVERVVIRGHGNAGQLGHLTLQPDGLVCNCGRRGCSEVLASGTALGRLIAEAGLPAGTSVEALLERRASDPAATDVLRHWASAWRAAIDTVVAVVDPELVVLGGGLGGAAVAALDAFAPESSSGWFTRPVVPARLGDDAGVIGAGLRALEL